ncbi:MAG TPA: hypothetical protein PLI09_01555 [Candidatus Hydrogenedentes bacterium]|nr:hypothetical protein [Candidatus Hydrogenedentota bacterium]
MQAHIPVCFLAFMLWTNARQCHPAGLGNEPRKVFEELKHISLVDVVLPIKAGVEIRKRCVPLPGESQVILLQVPGIHLPQRLEIHTM